MVPHHERLNTKNLVQDGIQLQKSENETIQQYAPRHHFQLPIPNSIQLHDSIVQIQQDNYLIGNGESFELPWRQSQLSSTNIQFLHQSFNQMHSMNLLSPNFRDDHFNRNFSFQSPQNREFLCSPSSLLNKNPSEQPQIYDQQFSHKIPLPCLVEKNQNDQTDLDKEEELLEAKFQIFSSLICVYIYLEVKQFPLFFIPSLLLAYIIMRFFFVLSKKLSQNDSITGVINESFAWGFKMFFVGQLLLISLRQNGQIDWKWQDVFWPYWVFFYVMIGINVIFIILLISKILLKYLGQPIQLFEIKGLFWFFMLSNGLCVNSTLFVKGLVQILNRESSSEAIVAVKYNLAYILIFIIYTVFFRKGLWMFMFHFSSASNFPIEESSQEQTKEKSQQGLTKNNQNEKDNDQQEEQIVGNNEEGNYDNQYRIEDIVDIRDEQINNQEQTEVPSQKQIQNKKNKTFQNINLLSEERVKKKIPQFLNGKKRERNQREVEKSKSLFKNISARKSCSFGNQKIRKEEMKNKDQNEQPDPHSLSQETTKNKGLGDHKLFLQLEEISSKTSSTYSRSQIKKNKNFQLEFKEQFNPQCFIYPEETKKYDQSNDLNVLRNSSNLEVEKIAQNRAKMKNNKTSNQQRNNTIDNNSIESQNETLSNCLICFENEPDTVFLPCGHGGICNQCGMDLINRTGECYLCRKEIYSIVQIDIKCKDSQKQVIAATAAQEQSDYSTYRNGKEFQNETLPQVIFSEGLRDPNKENRQTCVIIKEDEQKEIDQIPGGDVSREDTNQSEDRNRNPIQINNLQHRQNELITRHLTQEENLDFQFMKESGTSIIGEGSGANTMNQLRNCEEEVQEEEGREQGAVEDIVEDDEDKKANSQIIIN